MCSLILFQEVASEDIVGLIAVGIIFFLIIFFGYWFAIRLAIAMRFDSAVDKTAPPEVQDRQRDKEMENILHDFNQPPPSPGMNSWLNTFV